MRGNPVAPPRLLRLAKVSLLMKEEVVIASSSATLQGRALLHEAKASHYKVDAKLWVERLVLEIIPY